MRWIMVLGIQGGVTLQVFPVLGVVTMLVLVLTCLMATR
jgi:hypothetical protein